MSFQLGRWNKGYKTQVYLFLNVIYHLNTTGTGFTWSICFFHCCSPCTFKSQKRLGQDLFWRMEVHFTTSNYSAFTNRKVNWLIKFWCVVFCKNKHNVRNRVIKVTCTVTLKLSNQLSYRYRICFIYLI